MELMDALIYAVLNPTPIAVTEFEILTKEKNAILLALMVMNIATSSVCKEKASTVRLKIMMKISRRRLSSAATQFAETIYKLAMRNVMESLGAMRTACLILNVLSIELWEMLKKLLFVAETALELEMNNAMESLGAMRTAN